MKRKLKRTLIVLVILLAVFWVYVEYVNRHSKNMTVKQKVLKAVYPAWMWFAKLTGKNNKKMDNTDNKQPVTSFYDLKTTANDGSLIDFSSFKGKKVLLVNTASNCGYTNQYEDLEALYKENNQQLVVIGFPANDFKEQEKGTDEEIASFCKLNYGVTFPLAKKSTVIRSPEQNPVFQWLTDPAKNGWCNQQPVWNFSKYIVNENGVLTDYFGPTISPASDELKSALK